MGLGSQVRAPVWPAAGFWDNTNLQRVRQQPKGMHTADERLQNMEISVIGETVLGGCTEGGGSG